MQGFRHFSPSYYQQIFFHLGVSTVVRLNELEYDPEDFGDFECAGLEFEDCTAPPESVVRAFLRLSCESKGLLAVHCKVLPLLHTGFVSQGPPIRVEVEAVAPPTPKSRTLTLDWTTHRRGLAERAPSSAST